ncbi:TetR family transcriptional regulator [Streptomyces sulfonofaciens]|uniref:TetR family transcriptional regulator n=1 Tax=Streptomyces sulfonofaciens TaxID=68272 RepID=A0A919L0E8_9ACTN|nr:TetR family transcriptional regulator [Streptomyces sulfonofaciens]
MLGRALEVFGTHGYRATSMLDLAAGTGVQRGSLYHAYGGKEQLFLKVFGDYSGRFLAEAARELRRADKRAALLAFFDFCVRTFTAGAPSRGCLSTRTAVDAGTDVPAVQAAVRGFLGDLEDVVRDGLAAVDGDLTVDLAAAARLVVTTTRGLAVLERAHYGPAELRDTAATLVTALTGDPLPGR